MRRCLRCFLSLAALLGALTPPHGLAQQGGLVIGIEEGPSTYSGKLGRCLYAEVSKRFGLPITVVTLPEQRRSEMADAGSIDGETSRIHAYGAAHPNQIRVEEALIDLNFALYTADKALQLKRVDELATAVRGAEYRRGILFCERMLKSALPAERITDVTDPWQGTRKLIAGRSDVLCELEINMDSVLHDPSIEGITKVRKLIDLGVLPTYPYLNRKHADLAPRMAVAIKAMKAEGIIEACKTQAKREMGWLR